MVTCCKPSTRQIFPVSVLALSSRFDGPAQRSPPARAHTRFQYSLCRVVLMVETEAQSAAIEYLFQYSLCRVVLMVVANSASGSSGSVSVLALSSRFDGLVFLVHACVSCWLFQYSLCRVVLMVTPP